MIAIVIPNIVVAVAVAGTSHESVDIVTGHRGEVHHCHSRLIPWRGEPGFGGEEVRTCRKYEDGGARRGGEG